MGPYFISRSIVVPEEGDMIDNDRFMKTFKSKVIMYLFEDAAKQKDRLFLKGVLRIVLDILRYVKKFDEKGIDIFNQRDSDGE